ncbi:MAG: hypothetical protein CL928_17570 [Deltaproteobacteria bacterium]|nr:hypothetical protein [Deltaproteobacteria bacterium]
MSYTRMLVVFLAGAACLWTLGAVRTSDGVGYEACLTVLDVGQGDSQLLSLPGGEHWLIDGGGLPGGGYDVGAGRVLPALRRQGVDHLERVLVSHADGDHFEGLFSVIKQVSVGALWVPSRRRLPRRMMSLLESAESRGIRVFAADQGDPFGPVTAPIRTTLLQPWPGWEDGLASHHRSENNRSLVLRVQLGAVSFLLTGDIEELAESQLVALGRVRRSTVLKVPHHGSRTSSTPSFVAAVDPLVAVAGIGRENRFGFPHASVSSTYLARGSSLYWTGRHGSVRACTDGYGLTVEQEAGAGQWSELRSWSPAEVLRWFSSGDAGGEHTVGPAGDAMGQTPRRLVAEESFSSQGVDRSNDVLPLGHQEGLDGSASPVPAAATPPPPISAMHSPELTVTGAWRRQRRHRSRLRAPWKGP